MATSGHSSRLQSLIAGGSERCLVWERAHGPIPKGFVIHHLDRDPLNDAITNLQLQTRAEHLLEHRPEVEAKRLRQLRQHGRKKQRRP